MKNDEENYFFSKIGKKSKMIFGGIYLDMKNNKDLISNHYLQQFDNLFLEEEERKLNISIFDSPEKKVNKSLFESNISLDSFFYDEGKKPINKYKYHQIHLERIKNLKTSQFFDENQKQISYYPNYDFIKSKIISGPKWNKMTGRKKEKELILNKSFKDFLEKIKLKHEKKKKYLKKLKKIKLKKNSSSINFAPKLQKLQEKIKLCTKFEREKNKKTEKKTPIKIVKKLNSSFPEFRTSEKILLQENDINNKNLQNIFNLETSINNISKINKRKSLKTDTKIFRNNDKIGLNYEQIKMINSFKSNKNNFKEKIKKPIIKLKNGSNEKNKLIKIENTKEDTSNKKDANNTEINLIKKSFNYFINKSKIKKLNNDDNSKTNNYKSFYLNCPRIIKNQEFYKLNFDELNVYSFPKFDNVTFKSINSNK